MKKTFCLLLAGILLVSCLMLPVFPGRSVAETLPEESQEASEPAASEEEAAQEEQAASEEEAAQEEEAASEEEALPAEEEKPLTEEEKKIKYSTIRNYLSVDTGTAAYWDEELTIDAGFFTKSGNLYAQAVSDTVWRATFFDTTSQVNRTVFLPMDKVRILPSAAVKAITSAMAQNSLTIDNGFPIFQLSFYLAPQVTVSKPTEAPADEGEAPAEGTEEPAADGTEEPALDETEEPAADETEEPALDETEEPAVEETEEPLPDEAEEGDWMAAPTGLTAELTEDETAVILSWTGNGAAKTVRVYELLGDSGNVLADVEDADTFTTGALTPGDHIFYVRTYNGEAFGEVSEYAAVTVPADWKAAPTDLTAMLNEDGTAAVLIWTGNGAALSYRVYEMIPGSTKARALGNADDADTFTTKALEPGEHVFLVRARLGEEYGKFSETAAVTVPMHWMASPTDLTAELTEDGTAAVLTWTGNGLASSYRVYEMIPGTNKARLLGTAEGEDTFTTGALEPGEHTFRVRSRGDDEDTYGIFSEPVTIVIPEP